MGEKTGSAPFSFSRRSASSSMVVFLRLFPFSITAPHFWQIRIWIVGKGVSLPLAQSRHSSPTNCYPESGLLHTGQ